MPMRRTAAVVAVTVALATLLAPAPPDTGGARASGTAPARRAAPADLNGDGFDDLAVGVPGEALGSRSGAGALNLLLGSEDGIVPGADVLSQDSQGVGGTAEAGDAFGAAVAKGRFNDDDHVDLAVGSPGEAVGGVGLAGAVNILYGSAGGLTGGRLLLRESPAPNDRYGTSLAAGDFNGDTFTDLAVGAPGVNVGAVRDAGAVTILFGSADGITPGGAQTLTQGSGGVAGTAEDFDWFGHALAAGTLAGDDLADLVVGVPGEDVGEVGEVGAVNVLAGSPGGLVNGSLVTQGNPEVDDAFGMAVATGDLDAAAGDDVAVGAFGETVNGRAFAGAVSVLSGPPERLASERLLHQGTAGIPGTPETDDRFGIALAPVDADGVGPWGLAVGVRSEDVGPDVDAGAVNLLAGSPTGPGGGRLLLQANPEDSDAFGDAIAGGSSGHDVDGDGFSDLAVGAPLERVGTRRSAGAVSVFSGSGQGLRTPGRTFVQGGGGLGGTAEAFDAFGAALA
jgi:FG-GAP repeat